MPKHVFEIFTVTSDKPMSDLTYNELYAALVQRVKEVEGDMFAACQPDPRFLDTEDIAQWPSQR